MSLLALQAGFQAFVRSEETDTADFLPYLATPPGGDGRRRMGVYHHAYRARLGDVLREVFDKTWGYLGDDAFDAAVQTYVRDHASTSASLDDYGAAFPAHVAAQWPDDVELGDLVWLDWAMRRVFDGPDAAPVSPDIIAALDGDAWTIARFEMHPTLTVRPVNSHVGALWAALDVGSPLLPAPLDAPRAVRVWRKGLQPHFRMIDPVEATALSQLVEGQTFADVCEHLARSGSDQPVEQAAGLLGLWMQDELIVALHT